MVDEQNLKQVFENEHYKHDHQIEADAGFEWIEYEIFIVRQLNNIYREQDQVDQIERDVGVEDEARGTSPF